MKWYSYIIKTKTKFTDIIGNILTEIDIAGFEILDNIPLSKKDEKKMYTDISAILPHDDGNAKIRFYTPFSDDNFFYGTGSSIRDDEIEAEYKNAFYKRFNNKELIDFLQEKFAEYNLADTSITCTIHDDSEWKDTWKNSFKPIRIADDVIIKPVWEDISDKISPSDVVIDINPGQAFGTGSHETTRLCLMALKKNLKPGMKILDAGCGSGILSITSLKLGADYTLGIDIDKAAISDSLENAGLNNIESEKFTALEGNILKDTSFIENNTINRFDIIIANILADVIISLTPVIIPFLKKNGYFITSGILSEKSDEVEKILVKNNFEIIEKNTIGEWVAFTAGLK